MIMIHVIANGLINGLIWNIEAIALSKEHVLNLTWYQS